MISINRSSGGKGICICTVIVIIANHPFRGLARNDSEHTFRQIGHHFLPAKGVRSNGCDAPPPTSSVDNHFLTLYIGVVIGAPLGAEKGTLCKSGTAPQR
jgi:hypothetical protein